jgi:hypothetical protein
VGRWSNVHAEKNRRFVNVTPDTSTRKIGTAKGIIGLRYGSLPEEYDELVVSRDDRDRVKHLVNVLTAKLRQHNEGLQSKDSGVKIPFVRAIADSIPSSKVWSMTIVERMMKYISIIAKVNMDNRPKLVNTNTGQVYPIATFEDLKEALKLMERGASGVRPYLSKWFNDVFIPAFKDLGRKPNELTDYDNGGIILIRERHVGLTTEQLAEKTKKVYGGSKPSSKEILDKYIYPLLNQGLIDGITSEVNRKYKILFPVEEENISTIFEDPDNPKLKVPSPDIFPSKNVLKVEFGILSERYVGEGVNFKKIFSGYKILDADGKTEITVDELLDRYFGDPEECFNKSYGNGSMLDAMVKAAVTNNIAYQMQVIQRQKNYFILPPALPNVPTRFSNNPLEEQNKVCAHVNNPTTTTTEPESSTKATFKCFYCYDILASNDDRRNHRQQYHPDKRLDYPTSEDFENRLDRQFCSASL